MGTEPDVDAELSTDTREALEAHNLSPLWELERGALGHERDALEPEVWKWADIRDAIDRIAADVPVSELPPGFRRRVAVPINPTYDAAISHTLYVGVQTVSPGETALSHRHGANALRVTIDGDEAMRTIVDGEAFPMQDGDVVTTPQWEWHGHVNESDEEAAWLDVLDLPLVLNSLNATPTIEEHEETRQPTQFPQGYHDSQHGPLRARENGAIPGPFQGRMEPTAPARIQWDEAHESLLRAAEHNEAAADPHDGVVMEYVNPATGHGPLFPTFDVRLQLLEGGVATEPHLHNTTEVYFVREGSGQTEVGETTLAWDERDVFVVPPGRDHHHEADEDALLFAFSDRPVFEGINLYYEQPQ